MARKNNLDHFVRGLRISSGMGRGMGICRGIGLGVDKVIGICIGRIITNT